jgi:hypothetical protein
MERVDPELAVERVLYGSGRCLRVNKHTQEE